MSALTSLSVEYTDRGLANVKIGSTGLGPDLVAGTDYSILTTNQTFGEIQINVSSNGIKRPTSQVDSGLMAGIGDSYSLVNELEGDINELAALLSSSVNGQHRRGIDLDGRMGGDMFRAAGLEVITNPAATSSLDVELKILEPSNLPKTNLTVTFDGKNENWVVSGDDLQAPLTSGPNIKVSGFQLSINGVPNDRDQFVIQPTNSAAADLKFILTRPQEIAASGLLRVEANLANSGEASMEAVRFSSGISQDGPPLNEVFDNSLSPIEALEFLGDGKVAVIPAGTPATKIMTLAQQSTARFEMQPMVLRNAQKVAFSRVNSTSNGPHEFDISYSSAYPNADESLYWTDASEIADLLNKGVLRSTSNPSVSLQDLGIYASGSGGFLTLSSNSGDFANGAQALTGAGGISAVVAASSSASDLQIFTREGRHLAGKPLSQEQIASMVSRDNGFGENAVYMGDYLNDESNPYRGMKIDVGHSGGSYEVRTGSNGNLAQMGSGAGVVPANNTQAHSITLNMANGGVATIPVGGGVSAKSVAKAANDVLGRYGVSTDTYMAVEMYGFSSGKVKFNLESENRMPEVISADVTATDVSNLALAINNLTSSTGVSAVTSKDKSKLILNNASGEDIVISDLSTDSSSFSARIIDDDGIPIITPVGGFSTSGSFTGMNLGATTKAATTTTGTGSGATFNISISSGTLTATLASAGNGYAIGDKLKIKGSSLGGSDGTNDLIIQITSLDSSSALSLGTGAGSSRIDSARFSGQVLFRSAENFNVTTPNGTKTASAAPTISGLVAVTSNLAGNLKEVDFDVFGDIDINSASNDGLSAVSAGASYTLSIPGGNAEVNYEATVTSNDLPSVTKENVNKALVDALRNQAPIVSLSGSTSAARVQDTRFGLVASEAIDSSADSVNIRINGSSISVNLANYDGAGNAATTAAHVISAISDAVNQSNLGVTASTEVVSGVSRVILTGSALGQPFTVDNFEFIDAANSGSQSVMGLVSNIDSKNLPPDGTSFFVNYDNEQYEISMRGGEVVVLGGEPGRLTAYFDASNKLQIFGGGNLSGSKISVTSDTDLTGNSINAEAFGIMSATTRFTSQTVDLTGTLSPISINFGGSSATITLASNGTISGVPSGLTASWQAGVGQTGRLILEYDASVKTLEFSKPTDALGFKVINFSVNVTDSKIKVSSLDGSAFRADANASSLAGSVIELSNVFQEDLLVLVSGSGARKLGATYDQVIAIDEENEYRVKIENSEGTKLEIFDSDTGHSIATRTLSDNRTDFAGVDFVLSGKASEGDEFLIKGNQNAADDGRNLQKIIDLQLQDVKGSGSGGFGRVFGTIVAGVGETLRSGEISRDAAQSNYDIAIETEAQFSGVNLDEEAAALMEFQQAYQASARILSTARELFQSLIEVV